MTPACRRSHRMRSATVGSRSLHRQGESWATIGEKMGQRSKVVTADMYTHALIDSREVDRPNCSNVRCVPLRCRPR